MTILSNFVYKTFFIYCTKKCFFQYFMIFYYINFKNVG